MTHIDSTDTNTQRRAYEAPRLQLLGDVRVLTETGSQQVNESPLNWCLWNVNNVGNACRP